MKSKFSCVNNLVQAVQQNSWTYFYIIFWDLLVTFHVRARFRNDSKSKSYVPKLMNKYCNWRDISVARYLQYFKFENLRLQKSLLIDNHGCFLHKVSSNRNKQESSRSAVAKKITNEKCFFINFQPKTNQMNGQNEGYADASVGVIGRRNIIPWFFSFPQTTPAPFGEWDGWGRVRQCPTRQLYWSYLFILLDISTISRAR